MKKKKLVSVIAGIAVVASLTMGSLAFFTSHESVTNSFATQSLTETDKGGDKGIDIDETFDKDGASKMLPGDTVNKDVQVRSTANYPQLIRVKLTPQWGDKSLDNNMIILNTIKDGNWVDGGDGYYYYSKVLAPKDTTTKLLDSVTLSTKADKTYAGQKFDVVVEAESIQATKDAFKDSWKPNDIIAKKLNEISQENNSDNSTGTTEIDRQPVK